MADLGGRTPINRAISISNLEIMSLLIEKGADIDHVDNLGWTPLTKAIHSNEIEIIKALIAKRAKLELRSGFGISPLSEAVYKNNLDIVKVLVQMVPQSIIMMDMEEHHFKML